MDRSHTLHELPLHFRSGAVDVEPRQEVVRDGGQRVLGPTLEPVDRAARNETGKLQRATPELLSDLK